MNIDLDLSEAEIATHAAIFVVSLLLLAASRRLLGVLFEGDEYVMKLAVMRFVILVFIALQVADILVLRTIEGYEGIVFRIGASIALVYAGIVVANLLVYFMRRRFGSKKQLESQNLYVDSYSSRLATIFCFVGVYMLVCYLLIGLWNFDSLLETTGFLGLIFAFLALSNAIWLPDIYYGLVILNSDLLEDGDTIRIDGSLYIIHRMTVVYTTLLNVTENHRSLLRNSHLLGKMVENLSRRAGTGGVRQELEYNVGYPNLLGVERSERELAYEEFQQNVDKMFEAAEAEMLEDEENSISRNRGFEWFLSGTNEYALTYTLAYYLKAIPSTHVTDKVREHVNGTRFALNRTVYKYAVFHGIDLSTPMLVRRGVLTSDRPSANDGVASPGSQRDGSLV